MGRRGQLPTGVLVLLFVALLDVVITRTPLFYGELSIEHPRDFGLVQYVQTMRVVRALFFEPPAESVQRVALLGDSRITLAARAPTLERELRHAAPATATRVANLGIFGARIGDLEALSRHLDHLQPSVVVLALGGSELLPDSQARFVSYPARVFDLGWRDGPVPPDGMEGRLDRWLRTAWTTYRYRELIDMALADRVAPDPSPIRPPPDHRLSPREFFAYRSALGSTHSDRSAWRAYQTWRRSGGFDAFVRYLQTTGALAPRSIDDQWRAELRPGSIGLRTLDRLLGRLGEGRWRSMVVLMPVNPLLEQDVAGQYHVPDLSERTSIAIASLAERHGVPVVDARRWVTAEAFVDFVHLFTDCRQFQRPLAQVIARALADPHD